MSTSSKRKSLSLKFYFLYYFEKIFGLCPLNFNEKTYYISNTSVLYTILLCTVYSFFFYKNIIIRLNMIYGIENSVSAVWDRILQILQYIVIIVTWINFGFRQKKIKKIVKHFHRTSEIAENLGIRNDNTEICRIITNYTLIINFLYFSLFSLQLHLNIMFPSDREKFYSGINSFFRIIYHNMFFLFVSALHIIYRRFRQLNIHVKFFKLSKISRKPLYRVLNYQISLTMEKYGILHNELLDLLDNITEFFFLPMLLTMATNFLHIVAAINVLYLIFQKLEEFNAMLLNIIFYLLMWIFIINFEFLVISSVSANLCETANNFGNCLHRMWITYNPVNCKKIFKKVSLMVIQRRAKVSLCGFLSMDNGFFYQTCGMITTYLIILLQLDDFR
ncbi:uncharacterized protein LOC122508193 isoform X3 [Leptopilina heterotoma]|uniref:uncharacterized protein LOC122508193 isoform X3 n=1 Tax=Leptopilina heterotoma TaxID=63436 RepID=UPI001CA92A73|nr:uncharacterized protein LOC122508193 isoform X3 [Leptopilina heterotoma]